MNPFLRQMGYGPDDRVVVIHADDVGMCQASLSAYTDLLDFGVLSCGSVMVPCPWFPAEAVTIPNPRSCGESESTLFNAPRTLKEPVFWRFSHLIYKLRAVSCVSGVRTMCGAIRASAWSIDSGEIILPSRAPRGQRSEGRR